MKRRHISAAKLFQDFIALYLQDVDYLRIKNRENNSHFVKLLAYLSGKTVHISFISANMSYYRPAVNSHNPTSIWNPIAPTAANIIAWLQCYSALIEVVHFFCINWKKSWACCTRSAAHNLRCKDQERWMKVAEHASHQFQTTSETFSQQEAVV